MASTSIGQLKVEIGADIRGLEREIRRAERAMTTATGNLSALSQKMSLAISLPLIGLGVGAIKAAGDLESLKLAMKVTFESAGRSAEAATAEVEKLRVSALAPGLDFEQAIRASVRLQNVGFSAEKARTVVEQLANAVASTGGTADDLGEVVNQFSQMIGKGKLFQDDIKIITGRMPIVASLMKEAFGTTTAEGLNKLGIDAREFVDTITAKMKDLPRAMGGINNEITNAFNAVKQAAASLGETLNKRLDITGNLKAFADWVTGLSDKFNALSEGQQKLIVGFGVFAVALGPALKAGQLVAAGIIQMRLTVLALNKALLESQAGGLTGIIAKWKALDLAMKASYIGIAVGIVVALGVAFASLSHEMTNAEKAQKAVSDVSLTAANNIVEEKLRAEQLIGTIKDQTLTRKEHEKALNDLKAISPQHFGRLDLEKTKVEDLDLALSGYVDSLLRAAKAQAAFEQIKEIEKDINNLQKTASPGFWQSFGNVILAGGNVFKFADKQVESFNSNIVEQKAALEAQKTALEGVIKANTDFSASTGSTSTKTKEFTGATGEASKSAKVLKEVLSDIAAESDRQDLLGAESVVAESKAIEAGLKKLLDAGFAPTSKAVTDLKSRLVDLFNAGAIENFNPIPTLPTPTGVTSEATTNTDSQLGFIGRAAADAETEQYKKMVADKLALEEAYQAARLEMVTIGSDAIASILNNAIAANAQRELDEIDRVGAKRLANAKGDAKKTAQIQKELDQQKAAVQKKAANREKLVAIGQAIINTAVAITKASTAAPAPLNIPLMQLAAFQGAAQLAVIASQSFANGTKYAPGGLAMVGERGRELVQLPEGARVNSAPETRRLLAGGNSMELTGMFTIKGNDLVLVVDQTRAKQARYS